MLTFATEFPVPSTTNAAGFLAAVRTWILESPYSKFDQRQLADMTTDPEWHVANDGHRVEVSQGTFESIDTARMYMSVPQEPIFWHTDIIFSRNEVDAWVSVRVSNDSDVPASSLPEARKPVVIKTILEMLGGGRDGVLDVAVTRHRLEDHQVKFAADLILGRAEQRLPIVYVSHPFRGGHRIDADVLANSLAGMAHVIVEPNSEFARRLQNESGATNAYNGSIGVYWPEGYGQSIFRLSTGNPRALIQEVVGEIRAALVNRRPLFRLTKAGLDEVASRQRRVALAAAGSDKVDEYTAQFDAELEAGRAKLEQAEQEIAKLNARLRAGTAGQAASAGFFDFGAERDFLPGERREIVLEAVANAAGQALEGTRKRAILQSVLDANDVTTNRADAKDKLQAVLRQYSSLNKPVREGLVELGFTLSEEGRHHKLTYRDDGRYVFSLAKTASDHRGGLNLASDIAKMIF